MDSERPSPDELLARVQADEARTRRGRLKVFFGYAAGVGKTYAMLDAARRERAEGVDVVVGYVEPHGRKETEALLEGMEILPPLQVSYRGVTVREFDLDAALARRPQLILVDELAHTNAEGLRHAKRWQDIEELLDAGIDVWTTCNVQHVESLNDVVAKVSGIVMRETVPDDVFARADEMALIDLPPEDLLERLAQGKVYIPEQAARALQNFFRKDNLVALRELALRRTAERVHADVQTARQARATRDVWATRERLLVCVGPSPTSARLIRSAKRLADSLGAEWVAVHVDTPQSGRMSSKDRGRLLAHLRLAERLGAETSTISGDDMVEETIRYAQERNVTKVVVGKSELGKNWLRRTRSPSDRLIRNSGDIDVYVIHGVSEAIVLEPLVTSAFSWNPWLGTAGVLAACTGLAFLWNQLGLTEANLVMTYLLGVMLVAFRYGRAPAIVASVLSVLLFDLIFTEPYFRVVVNDTQYVITFGVMLIVGIIIATLTARVRRQAELSRRNERRIEALYHLGRKLTGIIGQDFIAAETERAVAEFLGAETAVFLPRDGNLRPILDHRAAFASDPAEIAVAQWVFDHGQIAGRGTDTLPSAQALYLPLESPNGTVGVLAVHRQEAEQMLLPEYRQILENYSTQVAMAVERDRLTLESDKARIEVATERLRSTLLTSVSHDLRTPLAVIAGATSSLLHANATMPEETRHDLLDAISKETDYLSCLVENLLRLTQLSSAGALAINREWHPLEDLIGSALRCAERTLADRPVSVNLPVDVLWISADAVLVEQALVNLLENACRYTPVGTKIEIAAWPHGHRTVLEVADRGPGLPPGEEQTIFEKFQRGTGVKPDSRGAGLGLAICRAIMDAHGGRISARNREGGGAAFQLEFVAADAPPVNVKPDGWSENSDAPASNASPET